MSYSDPEYDLLSLKLANSRDKMEEKSCMSDYMFNKLFKQYVKEFNDNHNSVKMQLNHKVILE